MSGRIDRSRIICPCHDVTEADLVLAIEHGHTHPETIKRATAVYMGMCQGKFCAPLVTEVLAEQGIEGPVGGRRPAARLPIVPVALGALIQARHQPHGSTEEAS